MKRPIELLRNLSLRHLSPQTHLRLARRYNRVAAAIVELHNRKSLDSVVNCGLPLVYISQPPRTGGTLLRSLFDGHPSCFVFPDELGWQRNGFDWDASLERATSARQAYALLYDPAIEQCIVSGVKKRYPFRFNRHLLR